MTGNQTFTIIKPCAVKRGHTGAILADIQQAGFKISAMKYLQMTVTQAEAFYGIHKERPFFADLVQFMTSGPVVVAILIRENAVEEYRKLIGATNPANAAAGTIRKKYALNVQENAVHGSDSDENAIVESGFFFSQCERF
ncbi:MAG: nucleoside-diphosphate kinase [Dysgonamonadaceae bacterium]|jgi:nucleoside-diphosphate kinase|nr:nucleoside-diphosphate kinase [Dysgonamonadaceae bacterium]